MKQEWRLHKTKKESERKKVINVYRQSVCNFRWLLRKMNKSSNWKQKWNCKGSQDFKLSEQIVWGRGTCNTIAWIGRQLIRAVLSEWPFISCDKLKIMPAFHSHFTFIITKSFGQHSITLNVFMMSGWAGPEMNLMTNLLTLSKKVRE